jgi:crossover junction endodeoxyribonuclease RuvC
VILACDPGINGAFAYYDGTALSIRDMPTYVAKAGARRTDRRFIDEAAAVNLVRSASLDARILVIEQVGGIPGQGASSAFVFGRGVGLIIGAAHAFGLRIEQVPPATWKSALRVPADKRASRARASELLPSYSHLWPLQKHDGRAEASMIALYGWQIFGDLK